MRPALPAPGRACRAAALVPLLLAAAGCGGSAGAGGGGREPLVVLAAASLSEVLGGLEAGYERDHADVDLRLSFAGSQVLAAQVREGAPADVLVTADEAALDVVRGLVAKPTVVARNALAIVTAPGNPARITALADLAAPGTTVVLAGPTVPVGRAARVALAQAGVTVRPVSEEPDVRAVVSRVRLGEADAGIAYATDLRTDGVSGVPLAGTATSYPAAVVSASERPAAAEAFVAHLVSRTAQQALQAAGFLPPP